MSLDNFIAIVKIGGKYIGYDCCASLEYNSVEDYQQEPIIFQATRLQEAIIAAQQETTEYGYCFVNLQKGE